MALSAHKTAPQNSTQTMRFYPFVFLPERMRTACDRSGANGNGASSRGTRRTDNARGQLETSRRLCWTEDVAAQSERRASLLAFPSQSCVGAANRLQAFMERGNEGGIAAWYNYSADGERNIKLTSPRLNIQQNASMFSNPPLVYPTLYASSLVTLTKQGYTKHYFEEGRRICSKIGGGMHGNVTVEEIDSRVPELTYNYDDQFRHQYDGIRQTFHDCIRADPQIIDGVNLHRMLIDRELRRDNDEPAFFYHGDHLGSAAYLTYHGGVIQTLNYLPYGEDWVERNYFAPHDTTRLGIYRFNRKEKDYESGFHYYGARYYWSEVLTGWLSVDPMADKYPNISPYNYCMWNPIRVIDPDGRDTVKIFLDKGRFLYQKAEGDHYIKFCRAEVTLEEMTIPREECETIKELERATGRYSEGGKSLPYTTQYLEFSNPLWGKSVFEKIAKLGATREQVSKEWDYHILGSTGELSSSGKHNRMIHKNGRYSIFKEWHHFHPFNNDESYYPSTSDQDKARANPASTCTIYFQGKHFEFGGELPRKGYIDRKKFGNTWRKFAE